MNVLRLAELRKEKGISQEELAVKLEVNQTAVSQWERGVYCPSCEKLPKIAKILDCSIDELFEKEG